MTEPVRVQHRIGGSWRGDPVTPDRNPADDREIVALSPKGTAIDAQDALEAARGALAAWARMPALARGEILFRAAELLTTRAETVGRELALEEGKTLAEGIGETRRAATILRYFAGQTAAPTGEMFGSAVAGTRMHTLRQPVGVVAAITPWNFPIAIPAWKVAPALAFGNTVLLKPAGATPLTAFRLVEALVDAGLPDGVLNLVYASGADVSAAWIRPGGIDALSFTGSEAVGRALQRQSHDGHIKVQLEMGGKNAVVVMPDADLERTSLLIARGAYASAGQKCTATSRVIAVGSVAGPLREALAERIRLLVPGDPLAPETSLGPVIDHEAVQRIALMVNQAVARGARVVARTTSPSIGSFTPAVLLDGIGPLDPIAQEEVFGPVASIIEVPDLEAAMRVHNAVAYGLSASIFTNDLAAAEMFIQSARAGILHVNGETAGAEPHVPFGGMLGSSSWSREQGRSAEEFYTQVKTVYLDGLPGVGLFDYV